MNLGAIYEASSSRTICAFCQHRLTYGFIQSARDTQPTRRRFLHASSRASQAGQAPSFSDPDVARPPRPAPTASRTQRQDERSSDEDHLHRRGGLNQDTRTAGGRFSDPEVQRRPSYQPTQRTQEPYPQSVRGNEGFKPRYTSVRPSPVDGSNSGHQDSQPPQHASGWNQLRRRGQMDKANAAAGSSETPANGRQSNTPLSRQVGRQDSPQNAGRPFGQHTGNYVGFNGVRREESKPQSEALSFRRSDAASTADQGRPRTDQWKSQRGDIGSQREGPRFRNIESMSQRGWSFSNRGAGGSSPRTQEATSPDPRSRSNIPQRDPMPRRTEDRDAPRDRRRAPEGRVEQGRARPNTDFKRTKTRGEDVTQTSSQDVEEIPETLDSFGVDADDQPRRSKRNAGPAQSSAQTSKRRQADDKSTRRAEKFAEPGVEDVEFAKEQQEKADRERKKKEKKEKREAAKQVAHAKKIELPPFISVGNLSTILKVRPEAFGEKLEEFGFQDVNNEHVLNFENASLIAMEYGFDPLVDRSDVNDLKPRPPAVDITALPQRPPVVTIMGHVDHGKTTLLDFLRSASVAANEHGGITQHIGAFSVPMASGQLITFLDTPGHAAFLSMRQRGANVTDIVVLVVAADDSVKPQTIEAIKHARAAKVPIIVAINKVDKDEADVEGVKQDLLVQDIEVEDFGGDIQAIPVSGKTGQGLDKLEEAIVTQAEILDMRAEQDGAAEGWVLEASTKRSGRVATVLVRRGTLRVGDIIVAGTTWARVRTLKNEAGVLVEAAPPGTPVEIDGWRDQATAGDEVLQAPTEQKATSVVEYRESRLDQDQAIKDMEVINENRRREQERYEQEKAAKEEAWIKARDAGVKPKKKGKSLTNADYVPKDPTKTELFFIIKADVSGSAEAIEGSLHALPLANQPISLNILRLGVGPVSEFDIDQISAVPDGHGYIVSFNQPLPPHILGESESAGATILDENIIYKVIDEVRATIETKLPPIITKRVTGDAEAAQVFEINIGGRKTTKVAGCKVRNGSVTKGGKVAVYRGGNIGSQDALVYDGIISSLKSVKKDVQEMRKGTECGISFDNWTDFEKGDLLQCYEEKSEPRRLL